MNFRSVGSWDESSLLSGTALTIIPLSRPVLLEIIGTRRRDDACVDRPEDHPERDLIHVSRWKVKYAESTVSGRPINSEDTTLIGDAPQLVGDEEAPRYFGCLRDPHHSLGMQEAEPSQRSPPRQARWSQSWRLGSRLRQIPGHQALRGLTWLPSIQAGFEGM